ncbi:MAG: ArsR family transcriptional regulator [Crenarchaeota archaeon]|nr:ArsR family transcriptional regulator [Thermoproteota archaeon]
MSRIADLEMLKEVFSPSRILILLELAMGEKSLTELSKSLGLAPSTVHYHLKKLERLGLVKVSRIEQRGNIVVKYYRASEDISVLGTAIPKKSLGEVLHLIAPCIVTIVVKILEKLATKKRSAGAMHIIVAKLDSEQAKQVIHELNSIANRIKELERESRHGDCLLTIALTAVAHRVEEGK